MKPFVAYIRDEQHRPFAAVAAVLFDDNQVQIGYSLCHEKDVFEKATARNKAIGRAQQRYAHGLPELGYDLPTVDRNSGSSLTFKIPLVERGIEYVSDLADRERGKRLQRG